MIAAPYARAHDHLEDRGTGSVFGESHLANFFVVLSRHEVGERAPRKTLGRGSGCEFPGPCSKFNRNMGGMYGTAQLGVGIRHAGASDSL
jgi:hypothetical protein